jgi:RNase P subunit RPR2
MVEDKMEEAMDKEWRILSEEILSGMKEWRLAHPKATFREIEQEASERVSRLQARMIQDAALASPTADWQSLPQEERPTCPHCDKALIPRGKQKRRIQGSGGREVELRRSYGTCPSCGMGLFPP